MPVLADIEDDQVPCTLADPDPKSCSIQRQNLVLMMVYAGSGFLKGCNGGVIIKSNLMIGIQLGS
jgi:hypothetical protein